MKGDREREIETGEREREKKSERGDTIFRQISKINILWLLSDPTTMATISEIHTVNTVPVYPRQEWCVGMWRVI